MSYFIAHGLDLWGGDIISKTVLGKDTAHLTCERTYQP